jgi:hypothetical protein
MLEVTKQRNSISMIANATTVRITIIVSLKKFLMEEEILLIQENCRGGKKHVEHECTREYVVLF